MWVVTNFVLRHVKIVGSIYVLQICVGLIPFVPWTPCACQARIRSLARVHVVYLRPLGVNRGFAENRVPTHTEATIIKSITFHKCETPLYPCSTKTREVLYPYTAERRDVLGNTSPEAQEISREPRIFYRIPTFLFYTSFEIRLASLIHVGT